jgi:hypothetical protein
MWRNKNVESNNGTRWLPEILARNVYLEDLLCIGKEPEIFA